MTNYFFKYKIKNFFLFVLILIESIINIVAITQINTVISSLLEKNILSFIKLATKNILLWILFILINTLREIYQEYIIQKMVIHSKNDIASHITSMRINEFCSKNPSEYISWFNQDCDKIESGFKSVIISIRYILLIIISLISILNMNYKIIIFIMINLIVVFVSPQFLMKKLQSHTLAVSKEQEKYTSKIGILLETYKVLYFSSALPLFLNKISYYSKLLSKSRLNLEVKSRLIHMIIQSLSILSQIGLILYSGYLVLKNQLEFGQILVISNLSGQLFNHISSLVGLTTKIQSLKLILKKLNLHSKKVSTDYLLKNTQKIDEISITNLSYTINNKDILNNVNFTFEKGKKYLIFGDSGSGKSTLLKIICGINKNFKGIVKINNSNDNIDSFIDQIDYLEENTTIFDEDLKENITFNSNINDYQKILDIVNLRQNEIKDIQNLSLGERQRVGIAQVLFKNKSILCFDESFSNLDNENLNKILDYILSLNSTVIIVSHHLLEKSAIIKKFDSIIHMKNGEIFDVS